MALGFGAKGLIPFGLSVASLCSQIRWSLLKSTPVMETFWRRVVARAGESGRRNLRNQEDGNRRRLHLQSEREESPLAQFALFSVGSSAHLSPRPAFGFTGEHATCALLSLRRPRRFDVRSVLGVGLVKADQESGGDVGTLIDRQGERFAEKLSALVAIEGQSTRACATQQDGFDIRPRAFSVAQKLGFGSPHVESMPMSHRGGTG